MNMYLYPSSHNNGSCKWPYCKGNKSNRGSRFQLPSWWEGRVAYSIYRYKCNLWFDFFWSVVFSESISEVLHAYLADMGVSKNNGTPNSSILIGFSIIFTIHFGVPLFLETSILIYDILYIGCFFCHFGRLGYLVAGTSSKRQSRNISPNPTAQNLNTNPPGATVAPPQK